jgi:hypothetical protein
MTPLRFSDLNPLGRAIIVIVAALTLAVAAVAFATSYGALYAWARDTGLYSERLTRLWPLLLDAAFIVAQLAAILAGILRGSRAWPILVMVITGALTVWFNLQHAGADPGRRLTAALPPVLMMLAFEIDVQIVRWVMRALGRPVGPITPPPPGMVDPAAALYGTAVPGPYGLFPPHPVYGQMPSATSSENPHNGHTSETKRRQVEAYLATLDGEQLGRTAREITAELTDAGMDVSERYVARILDAWTADRRGSGARRKGGR